MTKRSYLDDVVELKNLLEKPKKPKPVSNIVNIPVIHWCTHYKYFHGPKKGNIIPDGDQCCFRHWIGLPKRWSKRHPYYTWQKDLIDDWYEYNHFYMLKPPKIGATELYLALAIHEALINPEWKNGQIAIVVGTGANEAEKMIGRCKDMLELKDESGYGLGTYKYQINEDYNTKKEFSIKNVEFRAHPANNIDSIRSQPNMRLIIVDEGAFFTVVDQQKVREAFEHYVGGSSAKIVLISTAGDVPQGFMYDIEHENPSLYKKYIIDYYWGLEVNPESFTSLYNKEMLDEAKKLPSWNRNYLHNWGHGSGNIFNQTDIEKSIESYDLSPIGINRIVAVDPAYGNSEGASKFGLVVAEKRDGIIYFLKAEQYERLDYVQAIQIIEGVLSIYGADHLYIDGSQTGLINYFSPKIATTGVLFNKSGLEMTDHAAITVSGGNVKINTIFEDLVKQLRAVKRNDKGLPNKKELSFDIGDAFLMALWYYKTGQAYSRNTRESPRDKVSNKYSELYEDDDR